MSELPTLEGEEVKRYSRHLIMPEVGMDGQRKLKAASVLCVGAGGLGSPVAIYLAAAGRLRCSRLQQSSTSNYSCHARCRPFKVRICKGSD